MTIRIFQVDAFTDEPFKGNPAAVCILDKPADDAWMQDVAAEMNLSEMEPSWIKKIFMYDHPPVGERIKMAEKIINEAKKE